MKGFMDPADSCQNPGWEAPWARAAAILGRPDSPYRMARNRKFATLEEAAAALFPHRVFPKRGQSLASALGQAVDQSLDAEIRRVLAPLKPLGRLLAWETRPQKKDTVPDLADELASWQGGEALVQDGSEPLAGLVRRDLKLQRALAVLRLRFHFGWDRERVRALVPRPGWSALVEGIYGRPADVPRAWDDWIFADLIRFSPGQRADPQEFSLRSSEWLGDRYRALFHGQPLTEGALVAFCRIKAREKTVLFGLIEDLARPAGRQAGGTPWA